MDEHPHCIECHTRIPYQPLEYCSTECKEGAEVREALREKTCVMEADAIDSRGDFQTAETIRGAMHDFMENYGGGTKLAKPRTGR